jgi:ubiquinone/menaquinone biosynthesis C-methylase UbiE
MNNFNAIAGIYDPLKHLVFGRRLDAIEHNLLDSLEIMGDVLVVGGGTGQLLPKLSTETEGHIHFVEKSAGMLKMAKRRVASGNISFHHSALEDFELGSYDYIITSFFLDVFDNDTLQQQVSRLFHALNPGGKWIYVDFQKPVQVYHRALLKSMFLFFNYITELQSDKLLDHGALLETYGLNGSCQQEALSGFVMGKVFTKSTSQEF